MAKLLEVNNLSKMFKLSNEDTTFYTLLKESFFRRQNHKEFWALKDISFKVREADIVGLTGKNGSGKTTLLKLISNIYKPTSGKIILNAKLKGFLNFVGFERDLSALDNVYLFGTILGLKRKEINKKLDEILEFSGLEEFINQPLRDFSFGMINRLTASIVFQIDAKILFLDEMLGYSDISFRKKFIKKLHALKKAKKSLIIISHDLDLIESICNKVLLLDQGKQVAFGPTDKVLEAYSSILT